MNARPAWVRRPAFALAALFWLAAPPASADIEEFETWRFDLLESDDEYALDDLANTFPRRWEPSWHRASRGVRMTTGCASHEKWEMTTEIKLAETIGDRFRFEYSFEKIDRFAFRTERNQVALSYRHPGGPHAGVFYRPNFEKDFQDVGFFFGLAIDSLQELRLAYSFEDVSNNYWMKDSYLFERDRWEYDRFPRFWDLSGRFRLGSLGSLAIQLGRLSRTEKRVSAAEDRVFTPRYRRVLSGHRGQLSVQHESRGRFSGYMDTAWKRGEIDDTPESAEQQTVPKTTDRTEWWIRPGLDFRMTPNWIASVLIEYRERREESRTPAAPSGRYFYSAVSRIYQVSLLWRAHKNLNVDLGFARNGLRLRPTEDPDWSSHAHTEPRRSERRLFVALEVVAADVRFRVIESVELDRERYRVVGIHDKGFVQLMATF